MIKVKIRVQMSSDQSRYIYLAYGRDYHFKMLTAEEANSTLNKRIIMLNKNKIIEDKDILEDLLGTAIRYHEENYQLNDLEMLNIVEQIRDIYRAYLPNSIW